MIVLDQVKDLLEEVALIEDQEDLTDPLKVYELLWLKENKDARDAFMIDDPELEEVERSRKEEVVKPTGAQ